MHGRSPLIGPIRFGLADRWRPPHVRALYERRERLDKVDRAAPNRPSLHPRLPADAIEPHRPTVPLSADVFALHGRGDRAARPLGGRLDRSRPALPLPSLGRLRLRPDAGAPRSARELLDALALWPLADAASPKFSDPPARFMISPWRGSRARRCASARRPADLLTRQNKQGLRRRASRRGWPAGAIGHRAVRRSRERPGRAP